MSFLAGVRSQPASAGIALNSQSEVAVEKGLPDRLIDPTNNVFIEVKTASWCGSLKPISGVRRGRRFSRPVAISCLRHGHHRPVNWAFSQAIRSVSLYRQRRPNRAYLGPLPWLAHWASVFSGTRKRAPTSGRVSQ